MFKRTFRLPSPALVIATIALALVLGGTAVAASVSGDTKADTKLIKKLAPTLSVKGAAALGKVTYVLGDAVDAPGNGGSGFHETAASTATCPVNTIVIGTATYGGGPGVEVHTVNLSSTVKGTPPNQAVAIFDNFTNTDYTLNYVTAICSAATSWTRVLPAARRYGM
ncbi:MAG TPA: hypothetical protein VKR23_15190 [Gaiellaceae bacterium]|nr:hypothetical protein [Gaiellaceae bacterium]